MDRIELQPTSCSSLDDSPVVEAMLKLLEMARRHRPPALGSGSLGRSEDLNGYFLRSARRLLALLRDKQSISEGEGQCIAIAQLSNVIDMYNQAKWLISDWFWNSSKYNCPVLAYSILCIHFNQAKECYHASNNVISSSRTRQPWEWKSNLKHSLEIWGPSAQFNFELSP